MSRTPSTSHTTPALPLVAQLALAGAANCCGAVATNPLDVVKVRMQLARAPSAHLNPIAPYTRGFLRGLLYVLHTDGVRNGWFAGLAPSLLRESVYSGLRVGLYAPFRDAISQATKQAGSAGDTPLWVRIAAGAASGCIGCAVASPTDLIKVRLQASATNRHGPSRSILSVARGVIRDEGGVRALWQGVAPNIQRAALVTACQVGTYDDIKGRIRRRAASLVAEHSHGSVDGGTDAELARAGATPLPTMLTSVAHVVEAEGPALHACAAVVAGLVTAIATTPVDTAKSRLMNQRAALAAVQGVVRGVAVKPAIPLPELYMGTFDCLRRIVRSEGVRGAFAGFRPTWARLGIHTVVSFTAYEQLRKAAGMRPL